MTNTHRSHDMTDQLLPCPFCGGKAEVIHIGNGPNEGGSCVSCTDCLASSNVEFGRKENFRSNWNTRAALAAAPQPAPEDGAAECEVAWITDSLWSHKPAPQPAPAGVDMIDSMSAEEFIADVVGFVECGSNSAPADREALVEVIDRELSSALDNDYSAAPAILDALLARGLRLPGGDDTPRRCAECDCEGGESECTWIKAGPGGDETLAWGIVRKDGEIIAGGLRNKEAASNFAHQGERVVRVAVRVVEGGNDA